MRTNETNINIPAWNLLKSLVFVIKSKIIGTTKKMIQEVVSVLKFSVNSLVLIGPKKICLIIFTRISADIGKNIGLSIFKISKKIYMGSEIPGSQFFANSPKLVS
jgi:hypothetical protein